MTGEPAGPLSRPLNLGRVTPAGIDVAVEADEAERAALAADLDCPAIHALTGTFRVAGDAGRVRVTGRVRARLARTCVVTLDPFEVKVDEDVDVEFTAPPPRERGRAATPEEIEIRDDTPDELAGDAIDLGVITAEFLALGLDPYPRKPGATFEAPADDPAASPFAGLARLRPDDG